jgi:hypothetical protein
MSTHNFKSEYYSGFDVVIFNTDLCRLLDWSHFNLRSNPKPELKRIKAPHCFCDQNVQVPSDHLNPPALNLSPDTSTLVWTNSKGPVNARLVARSTGCLVPLPPSSSPVPRPLRRRPATPRSPAAHPRLKASGGATATAAGARPTPLSPFYVHGRPPPSSPPIRDARSGQSNPTAGGRALPNRATRARCSPDFPQFKRNSKF